MRRGFSLVETMVGASLLGLVLLLCAQVVAPSLRIWKLDQARATVEGTALVLEHRMVAELLASHRDSVTTLDDPPAFSFLQSDGYDPDTGKPLWVRYVIYSLDEANRVLYREVWPNPDLPLQIPLLLRHLPTDSPLPLSRAELLLVATSHNGTERPAGHYVSGVSVQAGDPTAFALEFAVPTPDGLERRLRRVDLDLRN